MVSRLKQDDYHGMSECIIYTKYVYLVLPKYKFVKTSFQVPVRVQGHVNENSCRHFLRNQVNRDGSYCYH